MTTVHDVLEIATQLSPVEQLEVIQALSRMLQQRYPATVARGWNGTARSTRTLIAARSSPHS